MLAGDGLIGLLYRL